MDFLQPAPFPESYQKRIAVATELAPEPRTCGEIYGHSDMWSDEMIYLHQDIEKYEKEHAYAKYKSEQLAWVVCQLRKSPEYTSEYQTRRRCVSKMGR